MIKVLHTLRLQKYIFFEKKRKQAKISNQIKKPTNNE